MKKKINTIFTNLAQGVEYRLRLLFGPPSLLKQFIIVVTLGCALSAVSIYTLVTSIYNMGRREGEKRLMELQHIEPWKLQRPTDSISIN